MRKDFFREIRKSLGRFLSIFFIVALGVSIFVGIRATEPDMRISGDAYVDENNLMDIKVVSTLGLTAEDIKAIEELEEIAIAEGAYSVDVLCQVEDNKQVLRVMSETQKMNDITVTDGRMPKEANECLADKDFLESSGYKIGDILKLEAGTEEELTDTLDTTEYKIVGSGTSPCFFALDRGSSTIGNGSVGGFLIVSPSAFTLEVYTEIYALVEGAKEATSFTDNYDALVENAIDKIESIQEERCVARQMELKESAQSEIDDAREELNSKKQEAEDEIAEKEDELKEAQQELKDWKTQIQAGKTELAKGRDDLKAGRLKLEESKAILNQLPEAAVEQREAIAKEIAAGEVQLAESEKLLDEKEKELHVAEREIASAEAELESGKEEIKKAKQELAEQITDGEKELSDAEAEVAKIELPEWYIFDRSSIPEYTGYGDNTDRIAALAIVFPTIFFLVAALISLTTMTRMVEEQRVQIGTLKALGYGKVAIMGKYVGYALLATVGGSALGWLVGEKLFPYVIIVAYKIIYINIPHVLVPYHWEYGIAATLMAIICTGGATLLACHKELLAQPAVLMRPEAPKIGKRTWIEKVPFIWKRLNFSWKSSLRNLFRYKKRFFMTLLGIGGCMGLLLVGYGLRDSITGVATKQYGELQTYDLSIYLNEEIEDENRNELETFLNNQKDITEHTNVSTTSITTQHGEEKVDGYLTVVKDLSQVDKFFDFRNRVTEEKYELSDEGVILSEKTANMLGVDVGDYMVLSEDGLNEHEVKIAAICENYMLHYVYMTETLYEKVYGEELVCNNLLIRSEADIEKLEMIGEEILKFDDVLNVQYTAHVSEQLNEMLSALDQVIIILIIVAGMLSFVVLYNLNNINITERRRELATLKVLGFHDIEVANYVYRENILLTIFGIIVGCGMGKFLHLFTIKTVEIDMAMFGRDIYLNSYLICAAFTVVFAILVNVMMYFKLKKINMVESLKSVE